MSDSKESSTLAGFSEQNPIPETMIWKAAAERQMEFLDSVVLGLFRMRDREAGLRVAGRHTSKSIALPVVEIRAPTCGLWVCLRDNFYNWAVTVESRAHADGDFSVLNSEPDYMNKVYFEGFERSGLPVYGPHEDDQKHFSGHVWSGQAGLVVFLVRLLDSVARMTGDADGG